LVLTLGSHSKVAQSVRAAALEGNCTTAAPADEIVLTDPDDLALVRKVGSIGFGLLRPQMGYFIGQRPKEVPPASALIWGRHPLAKRCGRSVVLKGNAATLDVRAEISSRTRRS
jgi:hypothetical protein